MKKPILIFLTAIFLVSASAAPAGAQPKKAKTKAKPAISTALKDDEIVAAFKDVLLNGVKRASAELGGKGGFYNNPGFKITMPPALQATEKKLRGMGYGDVADDLVVAMNKAAEQSVGEAVFVLNDEIGKMTVEDAKKLLAGPKDAVTQYFRRSGEKDRK